MADRTGAGDAAADAAAAAYAAGAPLSELARQLMRREEVLEMEAPGWLADQVACASRGWGVAADVGAAWMFAAGIQRLLAAERTDRLRWLTEKLCLNFAAADGSEDRRRVRADTPGGGLRVALALLATRTGAARQDVAAVGLAWGALRLHDTSDNHDCAAVVRSRGAATGADAPAEDSARVCPHAAAVQAAVALQPAALALLDPTQTVAVSLPGWVDDWLVCIAGRWQGPACGGGGVAARGGRRLAVHARSSARHCLAQRPDPLGDPHRRRGGAAAANGEPRRDAANAAGAAGVKLRRRPRRHRRARRRGWGQDLAERPRLLLRPAPHPRQPIGPQPTMSHPLPWCSAGCCYLDGSSGSHTARRPLCARAPREIRCTEPTRAKALLMVP